MTDLVRKPASANNGGELDNDNNQVIAGDKTYSGDVTHTGTVTHDQPIQGQVQGTGTNYLINGDFTFWQRGTSQGITSIFIGYTADRFYVENRGGSAQSTWDQVTDVPTSEFKYALEFASANLSSGDSLHVYQKIEADNIRHLIGKTVTFSFWMKTTMDVNDFAEIRVLTPDSAVEDDWTGSTSTWVIETLSSLDAPLPTTWVRKSFTFTVPANAQYGMAVGIFLDDADTGEYIRTTGWMLTEGSQVLDFRRAGRNLQDELDMCFRYYEKSYRLEDAPATSTGDNQPYLSFITGDYGTDRLTAQVDYKVTKRISPTLALYRDNGTPGQWTLNVNAGAAGNVTMTTGSGSDESRMTILRSSAASLGDYALGYGHWTADAEL